MAKDVAAPLPQLDLSPSSIIQVTLSDPAATITRLTLHGWQTTADDTTPLSPVTGAYTQGDGT